MFKTKKAGLLTKILILVLFIYLSCTLLNLRGQIASARADADSLSSQVADQTQRNAELQDAIDNSNDPEHIKEIARDKLGLVEPDEKVFYIAD